MRMLADIATGNTTWADIFFLVAVILAFLAALLYLTERPVSGNILMGAVATAVGFTALGLMVL